MNLVWAIGLMVLTIGLSLWLKLGLTWSLALATGRTIMQLLVVGYILAAVFDLQTPWAVVLILLVMLSIAARVAQTRISAKIPYLLPLIWVAMLLSVAVTLGYTIVLVIPATPWFAPQYLIPLAGIVLGSAMNAVAIAGERLVSSINNSRLEIETHLSLGATPQQAVSNYRREAIKAGMIPIINTMLIVGVVTLPGMITGQLLSGVDPLNAAIYQMVILFMLAFTTLLTTILVTWGLQRQFFNSAAQLLRY